MVFLVSVNSLESSQRICSIKSKDITCHSPSFSNCSVLPILEHSEVLDCLLLTTTGKFYQLSPNLIDSLNHSTTTWWQYSSSWGGKVSPNKKEGHFPGCNWTAKPLLNVVMRNYNPLLPHPRDLQQHTVTSGAQPGGKHHLPAVWPQDHQTNNKENTHDYVLTKQQQPHYFSWLWRCLSFL